MTLDRFAALDVEVASRTPIQVCAIGVVRFDGGLEVRAYQSLVRVNAAVRYGHIHGLTRNDLTRAPDWPHVWADVLDTIGNVRTIVAFRASFDRAALLTMSARHGVRLPKLRFICVAEMLEARRGIHGSLADSLKVLGLPFPGRPHDPLADARAAAIAALTCCAASLPTT